MKSQTNTSITLKPNLKPISTDANCHLERSREAGVSNKESTINGNSKKTNQADPEIAEEVLQAQLEAIRKNKAEAIELAKAEARKEFEVRKKEFQELVNLSNHFEKMAIESTIAFDKTHFAKEAFDLRTRIDVQFPEFIGKASSTDAMHRVSQETETQTEPTKLKKIALIQLGSLLGLIAFCVGGFAWIRDLINKANFAALQKDSNAITVASYGLDSFQKVFFELIVTGIDLGALLGILYIISPETFKYILPFQASKHDTNQEFNQLTPWQRQLKSYLLLASVLIYLGLRHSVKP